MISFRQLGLVLLFLAGVFLNPAFGADFSDDRFKPELLKLKDDVYVFVRSPSYRYPVLSNAVIIINEADVVVIDGGSPKHVEYIVQGIKELTDKPVSIVITTHWHQDHYWGNHIYKKHYPEVQFLTHENTALTLINRAGDLDGVLEQLGKPENLEKITRQIDQAIENFEKAGEEELATYYEDFQVGFPEVVPDLEKAKNLPFDATFKDKLVLKRPSRTIEVLYLGRANTNGDAFIYLPEDKILITGDTVVWPTPYGFSSYPSDWAETLRKALELDFEILIPGHGEIQYDTRYAENLIRLLKSIGEQTRKAVEEGATSLEEVRERMGFSEFDDIFAGQDPVLLNRFERWFKTPIMESAYKEAIGEEITQFDPFKDPYETKEE